MNQVDELVLVAYPWRKYLNKAQTSLFESEYNEFIIYCAIAAESFIKNITMPSLYGLEEDIVLKKLISAGKNHMIDSYYNVILKYMFGQSLIEADEKLYRNLDNIYKYRNALLHSGEINSETFKKTGELGNQELTFEMCESILYKLNETIQVVMDIVVNNVSNGR